MPEYTMVQMPPLDGGVQPGFIGLPSAPGPIVMNGDVLILSLTTSDSTGVISFRGRHMRTDGEIVPFERSMTFSGTGTQTEVIATLSAGWIIGFDVARESGTLTDGEVQASVHLGRNAGSLLQKVCCLASGEITNIRSLGLGGYTYGTPASATSVPTVTTLSVANPAPGADFSTTVTASQVWELQAIRFVLTCSVTVANREVSITLDDGTNVYLKIAATTNQTASQAKGYNFGDLGSAWTSSGAGNFMLPLGRPLVAAGGRIRSSVQNIDATDQLSGIFINYRAYV